jgi:hypothetical protein
VKERIKAGIVRAIILALFCLILFVIVSLCYWLPKRDCLCYRSLFQKDVRQWEIDATLLKYAEPEAEVMKLQTAECEHGYNIMLYITADWYSIGAIH